VGAAERDELPQTEAAMNRGRILTRTILLVIGVVVVLSGCVAEPVGYGYYGDYGYGSGDGWGHGHWGHGFAHGHGGFGEHGGFAGHGGEGGHGGGGHR
jgi:hypothetical protein